MDRVFEITGAPGTLDGLETAFTERVEALSRDPSVRRIKADVQTDGERETVLGPQINIIGYTIDVDYVDASTQGQP